MSSSFEPMYFDGSYPQALSSEVEDPDLAQTTVGKRSARREDQDIDPLRETDIAFEAPQGN